MIPSVGIVIPVANEERTIKEFTNLLLEECQKLEQYKVQVFYIMDSFSKDHTEEILSTEFKDRVTVLNHAESTGLVSCYIYGYQHCIQHNFDYIIEMDSGFSHKPKHLKQFLSKLDAGSDAVFGSRFSKGSEYETTFFRKMVSKMGTIMANFWLSMNFEDATSGYQAFRRTTIEDFNFDNFISFGGMFQTEIKYYIYEKRKDDIDSDCDKVPFYRSQCRRFFSTTFFRRERCYKYRIDSIPIEYVMSDSTFKTGWLLDGIKILFKLKDNFNHVYKENKNEIK